VDDGKGAATYVDVEGGYYISPWKYDVESISLTVTYQGEDYKVKTKDLELDGLTEVKVSVYELDSKVVTSTESAPDDAKKIAKFKIDLEKWTVTAMPKTGDLEMAVKFQYKNAVPADASNADAYPLDTAAQEQAEGGLGLLVHQLHAPLEAHGPRLVGGAAGGAAGDPNPGQGPVGDARLPDRAYRGPEQPLAVPDALLADRGPDTGHAVLELRLRPVLREGQDLQSLGGGEVDDIGPVA